MGPRILADEYRNRLEALRARVDHAGLDFFIISSFDSIYYLTGAGFEPLERPFFLIVPPTGRSEPTLLVPRLDETHMKATGNIREVRTYWDWPAPEGRRWRDALLELTGTAGRVGIEPSLRSDIAAELREMRPVVLPLVEVQRQIKSPAEIEMIRRAARYADRAVRELLDASYRGASVAEGFARTGSVTRSIIREVEDWQPLTTRILMATWAAPRSARPHSIPALNDRLLDGPHVALAVTRVNGYAAECERTYFTSSPTPEMAHAFRAMLEARSIASRMIRPGIACREIDAAVGEFLKAEGYVGEHRRLHRTGHGIGLGLHEAPWLGSGSDDVLAEDMVISIEPGIYLEDEAAGGFRHSDTVRVTRDGGESLTHLPTDLGSLTIRGWKPVARLKGTLVRRALNLGPGRGSPTEHEDFASPRAPSGSVAGRVSPPPRAGTKRVLMLLAISFAGLFGLIGYKLLLARSKQMTVAPVRPSRPLQGHPERLARAIQFPTFAGESPTASDLSPFVALRDFLEVGFPNVHRQLEREVFGGHSLLFRWKGTDHSVAPILLMSHLDVVPAGPIAGTGWTHPPFAGRIADGFIWGRGALDVKCGALGLLEAAELLLSRGFRPAGDVYLALGHDEETGGQEGNRRISEALRLRKIRFRFVLDEGGGLTQGIIDGVDRPVAFVGIAEKGYATIRMTARSQGGHSSMPPTHTAIGIIAAAVAQLESNPFPARIDGATAAMLDFLGPEMPWSRRAALANRWLTGKLITRQFSGKPSLNALIRTTMATTVVHGGERPNVLPEHAEVLVNVRLLPGETSETALRRIEAEVRELGFSGTSLACSLQTVHTEASHVSSIDTAAFRTLQRTIAEVFPDAVIAPGLSMVGTDSRHYAPIASDIYRFLPIRLTGDDLERIHGVDERIGIETYTELIGFLARLIENQSVPPPSGSAG